MKNLIVGIILVANSSLALAQPFVIEEVVTQKDYILSIDLFNKECKNIWTKQIPEFKKNNPEVKDPNILSINQKIKVQNCLVSLKEDSQAEVKEHQDQTKEKVYEVTHAQSKEQIENFFIGASKSVSLVGPKKGDSRKTGHGNKIEIGKYFPVKDNRLFKTSVGFMYSELNSQVFGNKIVAPSVFYALDMSYLKSDGKLRFGPTVTILYSEFGVNFNDIERANTNKFGAFLGADMDYDIFKNVSLSVKLQQSVSSRINMLGSIGLELRF